LGEYLVREGVRFRAIYSGALARQRQTAEEVRQAYENSGLDAPQIVTETCWNEFDLDQVYRDLAPVLCEADPQFRAEYEEMRRQAGDESSTVHRRWLPCDMAIVQAWTEGRHPCEGESWVQFRARVARGLEPLASYKSGEAVAVFSSATPIAISIGNALGVADGRVMRLAGAMYNSAFSTMRLRNGDATLFGFNYVAHLPPDLRTFR
jgi:broad specificity phosphatase PhoE